MNAEASAVLHTFKGEVVRDKSRLDAWRRQIYTPAELERGAKPAPAPGGWYYLSGTAFVRSAQAIPAPRAGAPPDYRAQIAWRQDDGQTIEATLEITDARARAPLGDVEALATSVGQAIYFDGLARRGFAPDGLRQQWIVSADVVETTAAPAPPRLRTIGTLERLEGARAYVRVEPGLAVVCWIAAHDKPEAVARLGRQVQARGEMFIRRWTEPGRLPYEDRARSRIELREADLLPWE